MSKETTVNPLLEVSQISDTQDGKTLFIDFRKPEDYKEAHIPGAINLWRNDIEDPAHSFGGMLARQLPRRRGWPNSDVPSAEIPAGLQAAMADDHSHYIALRDSFLTPEQRSDIARLGFDQVFEHKGIGGIADRTRIRCLHTWYAAHLVKENTVGRLLDEHWQAQEKADCN